MTHVQMVEMAGFTVHENTQVELPPRGLVLLTGKNGAGKSSLVEAVSWGLWGKTLRGTPPMAPGAERTQVNVVTDKVLVLRGRRGAKTSLTWRPADAPGIDATKYETTTKAQDALEQAVGDWEVWRRTSVFSSADASHFTLATDAERKALLEALLGLDALEGALGRITVQYRTTAQQVGRFKAAVAELRGRHAAAVASRDECAAWAPSYTGPAVVPAGAALARAAASMKAGKAAARDARQRASRAADAAFRGKGAVREAQAALSRLEGEAGKPCPACGQWLGQEAGEHLDDAIRSARANLGASRLIQPALDADALAEAALATELEEEAGELETRWRDAHDGHARAVAAAEAAESHASRLAEKERAVTMAALELAGVESQLADLERDERHLIAAGRVLSPRGVRAHLLGATLGGLTTLANAWLARLGKPGLEVTLAPYSEKAAGGLVEKLLLDVRGAAGGHGYRGASGGERKRIDVALLLALAEVAAGAHGVEPGTLFLDEVLDALDDDGVEAALDVVGEMARTRTVVLISHSPALVAAARPVAHWHADSGRYVQRR